MTTLITGNTYPVKEAIKALGGRWNRACQGWDVPSANADAANALVANAGPSTYEPRSKPQASRYRSNVYRFNSGEEMYVNKRGRCEDAPCCGCCS